MWEVFKTLGHPFKMGIGIHLMDWNKPTCVLNTAHMKSQPGNTGSTSFPRSKITNQQILKLWGICRADAPCPGIQNVGRLIWSQPRSLAWRFLRWSLSPGLDPGMCGISIKGWFNTDMFKTLHGNSWWIVHACNQFSQPVLGCCPWWRCSSITSS